MCLQFIVMESFVRFFFFENLPTDLAKMPTSENSGGVSHPTYPPVDTALNPLIGRSRKNFMHVLRKPEFI